MKFLSPEVSLYLYKSTICPCMEYCCHAWTGVPSYYLELLDKLQKWICRIAGPSLATSLEPLKCSHLKSFLFIGFTSTDVHLNCLNWFHFLSLEGGQLFIDRLYDFSLAIPRCYKLHSTHIQLDPGILYYWMLSFGLWSKWLYVQN